jgi:hypothetical protein
MSDQACLASVFRFASTDKFLEIAKANPKGVEVWSLIKTSKAMKQGKK